MKHILHQGTCTDQLLNGHVLVQISMLMITDNVKSPVFSPLPSTYFPMTFTEAEIKGPKDSYWGGFKAVFANITN